MSSTPRRVPAPRTGFGYLDTVLEPPGSVLALAHRGGGTHPQLRGLENTLAAFQHASALGYRYLETDVHATSDGVLIAIHDPALDRVAGRAGRVAEMTATDLEVARVGGREVVPTLARLLEEFPRACFNIDIKAGAATAPLAELIATMGVADRVCVGSFDDTRIAEFRRLTGGRVATSAGRREVARLLLASSRAHAARIARRAGFQVVQLPRTRGRIPLVTPTLIRRAHGAGVHVHVWTVDEPAQMHRMIDIGVDGIFTDRTDLLKDVLGQRGLWREQR